MDKQLLTWGLANAPASSLAKLQQDVVAGKRPDLTSDMLKHIMGESDSEKMIKIVTFLKASLDREKEGEGKEEEEEEREIAWENLELLVADLDNANDLENLKLWPTLLSFLQAPKSSDKRNALWIYGTAIQNNEKSQTNFLAQNPLPQLNQVFLTDSNAETRSKALYCILGCLKHNEKIVDDWLKVQGTQILQRGLTDPSPNVRQRTSWIILTLFTQTSKPSTLLFNLRQPPHSLLNLLLDSLHPSTALPTGPDGDSEIVDLTYRENVFKVLLTIVNKFEEIEGEGEGLDLEEREKIKKTIERLRLEGANWREDVGLTKSEVEKLESL